MKFLSIVDSTVSLVFTLFIAILFFIIGSTVLRSKKPLIVSSRWVFSFILLWFSSTIINSIRFFVLPFTKDTFNIANVEMILFTYILENWMTFLLMLLNLLMFLFALVFLWFLTQKSYLLYGISDEVLREALNYGLHELKSPCEETLTKIKLTELGTELQISLSSWMGTGLIKIKDRSKRTFLTKLILYMRIYFQEYDIATKNTAAIFFLIMGGFFTLCAIWLFVMRVKINLMWN